MSTLDPRPLSEILDAMSSKTDADKALAASIEELSREPAWAPGIPLAAKGQIAERYCK